MARKIPSGRLRSFAEITGVRYPQALLPFVIPTTTSDAQVGMAITARLAGDDPTYHRWYEHLRSHLRFIRDELDKARKGDSLAFVRATRATHFPECPGLGFGYCIVGRRGNAIGGGDLNNDFIELLLEHVGFCEMLADEPDALYLLELWGLDRVSDAFASILMIPELIPYTQKMAKLYRFDPACMKKEVEVRGMDPVTRRVVTVRAVLPVADDGEAIILVPKGLVRSAAPVSTSQYARLQRLSFSDSKAIKQRILRDCKHSAERLRYVMKNIFSEKWRYRPRRSFRDDLKRKP